MKKIYNIVELSIDGRNVLIITDKNTPRDDFVQSTDFSRDEASVNYYSISEDKDMDALILKNLKAGNEVLNLRSFVIPKESDFIREVIDSGLFI